MLHLVTLSLALSAPPVHHGPVQYDVVLLDPGSTTEPFVPSEIGRDGVVVGAAGEGWTQKPWRWSRETGGEPFPVISGWPYGVAMDRNRFGVTVGQLRNDSGEGRAVMWVDDVPIFLEDVAPPGPGITLVSASDINDDGVIAGRADEVSGWKGLGFVLDGADLQRIYAPGTLWAFSIGNLGEDEVLVGAASFPEIYAITLVGDEMTLLDHPDFQGPFTTANDRNGAGVVVGWGMFDPNPFTTQATLWSPGGQPRNLDPGFVHGESGLVAINGAGVAVGYRKPVNGPDGAVISYGQDLVDLNDRIDPAEGWQLIVAGDIDDAGWILGRGERNGEPEGFLLVPR